MAKSKKTTSKVAKKSKDTTSSTVESKTSMVSPDHKGRPKHIHADTEAEKAKIRHASQLMPEDPESPVAGQKRSSDEDTPTLSNKRRRTNVTIQRSPPPKKSKKKGSVTPAPPTDAPPVATKFLKVMFLGPSGQGKEDWMKRMNVIPEGPATEGDSSTSKNAPFTIDYFSKDYAFQSSLKNINEAVRMHIFSVDCTLASEAPSFWPQTLIPSMHHVVLVLDPFASEDAHKELQNWKKWLERNITGRQNGNKIPISLIIVNSKEQDTPTGWDRLSADLDKLCRYWHINKYYMMENKETSSDVIIQTLIERTWVTMDKNP